MKSIRINRDPPQPPLQSLQRGAKFLKVPLSKGDLGGSDPTGKSFQITSYLNSKFKGVNDNLSIGNWGNFTSWTEPPISKQKQPPNLEVVNFYL
ncbi:hypothetical protein OA07_25965 [Aphanizomenon flos-aquae 2012/KM1/D3]|nr:hypothetical protein OA07_25965 [Aphanizomenon flos-aquae 2012/KM1/D3]